MSSLLPLDDGSRYGTLCSHDARFDGRFIVGVTSTGMDGRSVCRVRTPRRENCRSFNHAAPAEHAGCRPYLRCRPERARLERHWSAVDATAILMRQALQRLDNPHGWTTDQGPPRLVQALTASPWRACQPRRSYATLRAWAAPPAPQAKPTTHR